MGGIKSKNIKELCAVGVRRIAVVTAISQAADIAAETAFWIKEIGASAPEAR
jgi:thiamine monophosphate synthase